MAPTGPEPTDLLEPAEPGRHRGDGEGRPDRDGQDGQRTGSLDGWAERICWVVTGVLLVEWSIRMYGSATTFPVSILAVVVVGGWGLATVARSLLPRGRRRVWWSSTAWAWATVAVVVGAFALWAAMQIHQSPGYGTDEIAFDQYAATLANHGLNPYAHSMAPSFALFRVPPDAFTYTLAGQPVTALSYPALAFELYMPFLALGVSTQLAVAVNVAAWAITIVLLFALLPARFRPLALVLGSLSTYVAFAVGGVTDVLFVPLLLGAAYRFTRFGTQRGAVRFIGPVCLGLAMAVKQTPWFLLPFLVASVWLEAAGSGASPLRRASSYLATAVAAFAVPNLPFIVANPARWADGVVTPFTHAVPVGQGVIGLSVYAGTGGGSLTAYSLLAVAVLVTLFVLYVASYPLLRPVTFLAPSVVLFFASRSFGSYLVALVPVTVLGALSTGAAPGHPGRRRSVARMIPLVVAGGLLATTVCLALVSEPPLVIRISGIRTTGQLATVEQLRLNVTNRSGTSLHPAFTIDEGGQFSTFWSVIEGPAHLGAGQSASYVLVAPNFVSQPSIGGGFQVVVFTDQPATVSTSSAYDPTTLHVGLSPDAVNGPVPIGREVVVRAELFDRIDQRVHRARVPVYLGQVIYAQQGLILSEASVNGHAPGQTPVAAYTDAAGIATFRIVGTNVSADPVYFEANLVDPTRFYPYGYSEILPIRFVGR